MHCFISYNHNDRHVVERLADYLQASGIQVWWDDSLTAGDIWEPKIDEALRESYVVIVVVTANAVRSHWVTYEWTTASTLGVRVIPLRVDDTDVSDIHKKLEKFDIFDCIGLKRDDLEKLKAVLQSIPYFLDEVRTLATRDALKVAIPKMVEISKRNPATLPLLLEGLNDSNHYVRELCVEVLGELRYADALPHLLSLLRKEDRGTVKDNVIEALGKIGDTSTIPILIRSLYDPNEMVRAAGAEALGLIGDHTCVEELIQVISDPIDTFPEVRRLAVISLGILGDERAVPALIASLSDMELAYTHQPVCVYAADALVAIGTRDALIAAREWQRKRPKSGFPMIPQF